MMMGLLEKKRVLWFPEDVELEELQKFRDTFDCMIYFDPYKVRFYTILWETSQQVKK